MKNKIQKSVAIFIFSAFILCISVNYVLQMYNAQRDMVDASQDLFRQTNEILQKNNEELEDIKSDIADTFRLRVNAVAYILGNHPDHIYSMEELKEIATLFSVDEIHIFNKEGVIISGTRPQHYNMTMDDGEQISFFKPLLSDVTLFLCQDLMSNTAEGKMIQYAATWTESASFIVQIGMYPTRLAEFTEKNQLSYIFSLLTNEVGSTLFAIDPETHEVLGSTRSGMVGQNIEDLGISPADIQWGKGFFTNFEGNKVYAVLEQTDSVILGRICTTDNLYQNVNESNLRLCIYLSLIFLIQWIIISKYLEQTIVKGFSNINTKLQKITDGNLHERLDINSTPEFTELSHHVNNMVGKLETELWHDELTGLYSRRGFYIELENIFKPGSPLRYTSIIMIDSDDLKKTNDKYGHEWGDRYLVSIATILSFLNIPDKIVARLSGDEFAIIIPYAESLEEITSYTNQLKDLRDHNYLTISAEERIPLRFSLGVATYGIDGSHYQQLLKQADSRMYEDKINRKPDASR